jgi:membrane glycosyltransferase
MLNPSTVAATAQTGLPVTQRRVLFSAMVAATTIFALGLAGVALSPGGLSAVDLLLLALYAVALPWLVIGFSISVIGFCVLQFARDPLAAIFPGAARIRCDEPVTATTAILICIRNEAPERVIRNLTPLLAGLAAAGVGDRFRVFVLSDTGDPALAAVEEERFRAFATAWQDRVAVTYRRRRINTEFKAGNIRDFCRQWGADYEFALTLDADSFMTADAVLRLVRIMQDDPKLGIVQSLVVGLPSTSAFARLFQFGMRLGMRSYTIGSAWWQADCGPYWGHNALLRLAPFIAHCRLPDLPAGSLLGGHILSHDQIEAVLMRRAGYHVRVLPVEYQSWEENPAALLEFIRRDLRWCHGNMQYLYLLGLPGIQPVSRYQLIFAILMFVGSPAWIGLLVAGTLAFAWFAPADLIRPDAGMAVLILTLIMWLSPKLATFVNVLSRPDERRSFGGTPRFLASAACETVFSLLLAPIMWFGHTLFLARLPFTRTVGWSSQMRDDHAVPVGLACRALWPHTAVGVGSIVVLASTHPVAIPYALLLAAGLALSIPLAVVTALPAMGAALMRCGIGRLPEETEAPVALHALALPALTEAPASAASA